MTKKGMEYEASRICEIEGIAVICVKMIDVKGEKEEYIMIEVAKSGKIIAKWSFTTARLPAPSLDYIVT